MEHPDRTLERFLRGSRSIRHVPESPRFLALAGLQLLIGLTAPWPLCFLAIGATHLRSIAVTIADTAALLPSVSGVIASLIPYAAETHPMHLRSRGTGLIAGGTKFGDIPGAFLGVCGLFEHFMLQPC